MYLRDNILDRYPNVWVTSDFHFNHRNILKFEARRAELFDSVESMNEGLVKIWNDKVGDDDLVLFLGDYSFVVTTISEGQNFSSRSDSSRWYPWRSGASTFLHTFRSIPMSFNGAGRLTCTGIRTLA